MRPGPYQEPSPRKIRISRKKLGGAKWTTFEDSTEPYLNEIGHWVNKCWKKPELANPPRVLRKGKWHATQLPTVKWFHGNTAPSVTPPYTKVRPSLLGLHVTKQPSQRMYLQDRRKTKGWKPYNLANQIDSETHHGYADMFCLSHCEFYSEEFAQFPSRNCLQEISDITKKLGRAR